MTNGKKQTAVEFYLDNVFNIIGDAILDKLSIEQINKIHDLSLQAKAMHKEEIITTWHKGYDNLSPMIDENNCGDKYYNETYGGNK
jgi:hypothetical protein